MTIPCEKCDCCEWWQTIIDEPCSSDNCHELGQLSMELIEQVELIDHYERLMGEQSWIHWYDREGMK